MQKLDDLDLYLSEIGEIPILTREKEIELGEKAKKGDQRAKEALVTHNLRWVVSVARDNGYIRNARKYPGDFSGDVMDIIQEGNRSLIKAIETYDPSKGTVTTYSEKPIIWGIRDYLKKMSNKRTPLLLDEPRLNRKKTLGEEIKDPNSERIQHFIDYDSIVGLIEKIIESFPERERYALTSCCMNGMSPTEAGRKRNCSRENVRQGLVKGRERIKEIFMQDPTLVQILEPYGMTIAN